MVKVYPDGNLSQVLGNLKVGESIEFFQIKANVKLQYPFAISSSNKTPSDILMVTGGTGITPILQALHPLLADPQSTTNNITLLYGSKSVKDGILAEQLLTYWCTLYPNKLKVVNILSDEPPVGESSNWKGERGYITKDLILREFKRKAEDDDSMVFLCGPPAMYNSLCGSREEKEVGGVLGELGFSENQVYKF